jgi:hypothetical protein
MAATVSLGEAAAALHDHFGARLEADRNEGRRLMADALQKQFSISGREAKKLVEELEQARTIRHLSDSSPHATPSGLAPGGMTPSSVGVGLSLDYASYWQIAPGDKG